MIETRTHYYWLGSILVGAGVNVAAGSGWRGFVAGTLILCGLNARFGDGP